MQSSALATVYAEDDNFIDTLDRSFSRLGGSGKKVMGFFSGGGGLDLGFSSSGFDVVLSSDIEEQYCKTLSHNLKHDAHVIDVASVSPQDIHALVSNAKISGIVGGPPCQSFSILGKRGALNDPRGQLVHSYIDIIAHIQPEFFLFENVPGLKSVEGGRVWADIQEAFKERTGFRIFTNQLNSASFGVPQKRERVFIVGFRDHSVDFEWPVASHAKVPPEATLLHPVTVGEAFASLEGVTNNEKRVHSQRIVDRYSLVAPGTRCRTDHTDRLHIDRPSGTVLVGSGAGGGRPFIHPTEPRHITVREAARLQSFPDWWEFTGGPTKQYRQVGNAVPPMLAASIAHSIMKALN